MLWAVGSLRAFICNYVLYSFGLILSYIFRFFQVGDAKSELPVPPPQADSEIDRFREELANFLFWSGEDVHEGSEQKEGETECSAFVANRDGETECFASMETLSDIPEDGENRDGETECSVLMEDHSDTYEDSEKIEVHAESSVLKEVDSHIHEDGVQRGTEEEGSVFMENESANSFVLEGKKNRRETEGFVFIETDSDVHEDSKKMPEDETDSSVFIETGTGVQKDSKKIDQDETEHSVFNENSSGVHKDGKKMDEDETESSVFFENGSGVPEVGKKIDEDETEGSVFMENLSNVHRDSENREEEAVDPVFVETDSATTTSKFQYMSGKDISGFMEEPTAMRFSFREYYMGPDVSTVSDNACTNTKIIADKEFLEHNSEKDSLAEEEKEDSVQEQFSISSIDIPFRFESEAFGGTDSSDEDYFLFNENSVTSDSESESSSSSGLIWGNNNKIDDLMAYQFLNGNNAGEGFESEILKLMMKEERTEDMEKKQFSCDGKVSGFRAQSNYCEDGYIELEPGMKDLKSLNAHGFGGVDSAKAVKNDKKEGLDHEEKASMNGKVKTEETRWEEELAESDSDEQDDDDDDDDDDDFEWEHDDLVEQLKLELRNARQGGLATILEEEEEEEEETESPKVVEDLKPLKIEEKLEYKDQIDEIEKVYKSYAEKMRKLDILNYQTMHAMGLLQLKDPLKLISIPKFTTPGVKQPLIPQNLWPRKASKNTSDPLLKFVNELHKELELVYVGQVCLSWEILCWQHKKAQELEQYDSQGSHRYNLVAGEFQLFQVLMQRFIENEPFQGPRIQNYVKNRCVIRNLLQVPDIKDDSMKDKNMNKGGEEDAIASGRLAEIIKECMRVFWEFVRADKDYGNAIFKVSQQIGTDLKDPAISGLLVDIRNQLQKKDRKLKDIVRSGNCIVRKFQKHHEDHLDHEQLVAQVGLRLISRVLNMSKLRKEQLIWCNEKLHRIKFLSRKIVQVEPSFLLFPC